MASSSEVVENCFQPCLMCFGVFTVLCHIKNQYVMIAGNSLLSAWNPVCMGVVYSVIGKLKLHPGT